MSFGFFNTGLDSLYGMNWFMPNLGYNNFYLPSFTSYMPNLNQTFMPFNFDNIQMNNWSSNPFSAGFNYTNNYSNPFSITFGSSDLSGINFSAADNITSLSSASVASSQESKSVLQKKSTDDKRVDSDEDVMKNYNSIKGKNLADMVLAGIPSYRKIPLCAKYVKLAISNAGLGAYESGHAYEMFDIMRRNSNFKEISPDDVDVSDLPAGCVLVYDKGVEDYSEEHGHTEITLGDGRAASDFVQEVYKKPSAIFIPV